MIKSIIKAILPESLKKEIRLKRIEALCKTKENEILEKRKKGPLIFLLATPNHGNIGDQAIAVAESRFLENELSEFEVVEISYNEYLCMNEKLLNWIQKDDVLCYHGGGNMGVQYFECEKMFRDMIVKFPNNKIITFPQTIFYGDSEWAKEEFENSKKLYNHHLNLTLTAREKTSFEIMKEAYPNCNVILTPDIVLYYTQDKKETRSGALTCLRNDVEKKLKAEQQYYIFEQLTKQFDHLHKSDTVIDKDYIAVLDRESVLDAKLHEFRVAEVVVTDRLHGMVFAYITNTPCIVFSNYNYKVSGVYEWIKENKFICFVDNISDFDQALVSVMNAGDKLPFDSSKFIPLKNAIKGDA